MSTRRCFKCQGLRHIASDCLNRKVVTLAKWRVVDEQEIVKEIKGESEGNLEENLEEVKEEADEDEILV